MKKEITPYLRLSLVFIILFLFSGCGHQRLDGIEVIKNPGEIGLERIKWSPVNPDVFLVTASHSGFLGKSEVFLFNVKNDSVQNITKSNRGDILGENWSFNGNQIILLATKDTDGYEEGGLWIWDKDTGGIKNLRCCEGIYSAAYVDQSKFIFSSTNGEIKGFSDFFLFDIETGQEIDLVTSFGEGYVYDISFSPIRNEIVFALWNDGVSTIHILNLENNNVSRIMEDRNKINYPTWSPSGELIAFAEPTSDGLSLRIMSPENECELEVPVTAYAIFGLTWSP